LCVGIGLWMMDVGKKESRRAQRIGWFGRWIFFFRIHRAREKKTISKKIKENAPGEQVVRPSQSI
jgi:hypothetical protein